MKFYTCYDQAAGKPFPAVAFDGDTLYPLRQFLPDCPSVAALIESGDEAQLAALQSADLSKASGFPLGEAELLAPIEYPRQDVICLGMNYRAHAAEAGKYKEDAFGGERVWPIYFSKRVNRAAAPTSDLPDYAGLVDSLDYEAELGVVIGKTAKGVRREDAYKYVFGYTVINDVSARNLQTRHKQWYLGKSLDGFTPMGSCIVTADEFPVPPSRNVRSFVNGELRQDSNTDLMIFDVAETIADLSAGMTLLPGTILAMGTPAGVGMGFTPPKFLKAGDRVCCQIDGIGSLTQRIVPWTR